MAETLNEKLYNKREAGAVLRCSEITIHRLIRAKRLGHYRVASRVYVGEHHIQDYLKNEDRGSKERAA